MDPIMKETGMRTRSTEMALTSTQVELLTLVRLFEVFFDICLIGNGGMGEESLGGKLKGF